MIRSIHFGMIRDGTSAEINVDNEANMGEIKSKVEYSINVRHRANHFVFLHMVTTKYTTQFS